jgi:hypothetical protein
MHELPEAKAATKRPANGPMFVQRTKLIAPIRIKTARLASTTSKSESTENPIFPVIFANYYPLAHRLLYA